MVECRSKLMRRTRHHQRVERFFAADEVPALVFCPGNAYPGGAVNFFDAGVQANIESLRHPRPELLEAFGEASWPTLAGETGERGESHSPKQARTDIAEHIASRQFGHVAIAKGAKWQLKLSQQRLHAALQCP